jgi:phosphate/sulfate permease
MAIGGGLLAGLAGGGIGHVLFLPFQRIAYLAIIGRLIGWSVLGALVGRGMALFVPNLSGSKALVGGAVGGGIAAIGFMLAQGVGVDLIGRLLGALILGFVLGLLIALVEMAFREAWLEVCFGRNEIVKISLGAQPVRIGSDRRCTVFAKGAKPMVCQYQLNDGKITRSDFASEQSRTVQPGDEETIGNVTVTVRAAKGTLRQTETAEKVTTSSESGDLVKKTSKPARTGPPPPPPPPPTRKPK